MNGTKAHPENSLIPEQNQAAYSDWRFCVAPMMDWFDNEKSPTESGR